MAADARPSQRQGHLGDVCHRARPLPGRFQRPAGRGDRSRRRPPALPLAPVGPDRHLAQRRSEWRASPWIIGPPGAAFPSRPGSTARTATRFRGLRRPDAAVLDFLAEAWGPTVREARQRPGQRRARGHGVATSIFYGDDSVDDPKTTRWRNVIVHEIAHQWFGNAVTESDWDHVWLSEGFATYFTQLFFEHAYGRERPSPARTSRDAIREFDAKNPTTGSSTTTSRTWSWSPRPGTYQKGAWTLHMLRGIVGDAAFRSGIQDYYRRHRTATRPPPTFGARWSRPRAGSSAGSSSSGSRAAAS